MGLSGESNRVLVSATHQKMSQPEINKISSLGAKKK